MSLPKYDENIHPDEWINDVQNYLYRKGKLYLSYVIPLVDLIIKLPTGIDSFEKLRSALKEHLSFTVFKNTNKRKLQLLKYITEREGGETSTFISKFCKLCYNAEINKKQNQFNKGINCSIVTLKHVATGKYLSSIKSLRYSVFVNNFLNSDALWNITFTSDKEIASYTDTSIHLQHRNSNEFLGIYGDIRSPVTKYTGITVNTQSKWNFSNNKLKNYQGYLKLGDIINIKNVKQEFLRSQDFHFTIRNDTFQEIVCHSERLFHLFLSFIEKF
ncbi:8754_t:CDS:2 [Funneliformis caledonium]|uniref:8754_t:CDS:1 n=1 Tax=Funneliformis caledonium TaxID=1117310 RepID=A0A9N9GZS5_9GLOM|nr:8754_t:CDS:2 [Funneliformis caledonium]